ncbi:MAG: hypothetical protein PHX83_08635 [Acidobacteriia bacterium]|nr:hypothetical protein [Terriglobia bacterium]
MRFEFYHPGINVARTLMVDGVADSRLNMSHWPGNRTPEHLKADTSTEICLNLAADPYADRLFENIEIVSNNHFDTDGLLSSWTALHPKEALFHREFLVAAAQAGDFGWYTTPQAVKFDLVVSGFEGSDRSPLHNRLAGLNDTQKYQLLYEHLLGEMPGLMENFESRYRDLWTEEFKALEQARSALNNGAGQWRHHPAEGLAVFQTDKEFPLTSRFNHASSDRLLTLLNSPDGLRCEFHFDVITWFETVHVQKKPRLDLTPLASQLNALEKRGEVTWKADPLEELYPCLSLCDGNGNSANTSLPAESIENAFVSFFRAAER